MEPGHTLTASIWEQMPPHDHAALGSLATPYPQRWSPTIARIFDPRSSKPSDARDGALAGQPGGQTPITKGPTSGALLAIHSRKF